VKFYFSALLLGFAFMVGCWCTTTHYSPSEVRQCACTITRADGGLTTDAWSQTACGLGAGVLVKQCSNRYEYRSEMDGGVWTTQQPNIQGDLCRCTCVSTGERCEVPLGCR
jgi:hypothetical protein